MPPLFCSIVLPITCVPVRSPLATMTFPDSRDTAPPWIRFELPETSSPIQTLRAPSSTPPARGLRRIAFETTLVPV